MPSLVLTVCRNSDIGSGAMKPSEASEGSGLGFVTVIVTPSLHGFSVWESRPEPRPFGEMED